MPILLFELYSYIVLHIVQDVQTKTLDIKGLPNNFGKQKAPQFNKLRGFLLLNGYSSLLLLINRRTKNKRLTPPVKSVVVITAAAKNGDRTMKLMTRIVISMVRAKLKRTNLILSVFMGKSLELYSFIIPSIYTNVKRL